MGSRRPSGAEFPLVAGETLLELLARAELALTAARNALRDRPGDRAIASGDVDVLREGSRELAQPLWGDRGDYAPGVIPTVA